MIKNIKKTVIAGALALAMVGTAVPVTANAASNPVYGYMETKSKATAILTCPASTPRYCTVTLLQSSLKDSSYTTVDTNNRNYMKKGDQVTVTHSVSKSFVRARGAVYNSTSTTSGSTSYSKQIR